MQMFNCFVDIDECEPDPYQEMEVHALMEWYLFLWMYQWFNGTDCQTSMWKTLVVCVVLLYCIQLLLSYWLFFHFITLFFGTTELIVENRFMLFRYRWVYLCKPMWCGCQLHWHLWNLQLLLQSWIHWRWNELHRYRWMWDEHSWLSCQWDMSENKRFLQLFLWSWVHRWWY